MKSGKLAHSVEYKLTGPKDPDGIIIQVRILDGADRHVYSTDVDGLTVEYVNRCLRQLVTAPNGLKS